MFIKVNEDGSTAYPYDIQMFKSEYPNVSLPNGEHAIQALEQFNIFRVIIKSYDGVIPEDHTIELVDEPFLENGNYVIAHRLIEKTAEQLQQEIEMNASVARSDRDYLLQMSDWTHISDSPLSTEKKAEWGAYRQALRDITKQDGFPLNVIWPDKP